METVIGKTIFLDSHALIRIIEDPTISADVQGFFSRGNYTLIINVVNLIEIYRHQIQRWKNIGGFLSSVPFCLAHNTERILDKEVEAYPNPIALPVSFSSLNVSKPDLYYEITTTI